jgi:hypothetical protein
MGVGMLKRWRKWLRQSPHFHIRERRVNDIHDLVALIDRFLDDKLDYVLEWDDFISWTHENENIERIRDRIAETEPLFFSKNAEDNKLGIAMLIDERNRAATLIGIDLRRGKE